MTRRIGIPEKEQIEKGLKPRYDGRGGLSGERLKNRKGEAGHSIQDAGRGRGSLVRVLKGTTRKSAQCRVDDPG